MARAHNIYLIKIKQRLVAAFTVKHECGTYLERQWPTCPTNLKVLRMPDGGGDPAKDITAEMYETVE